MFTNSQNLTEIFSKKPTAETYYCKIIERLRWKETNWKQVKAKMGNFRVKYVELKKWLDQTGQGTIEG